MDENIIHNGPDNVFGVLSVRILDSSTDFDNNSDTLVQSNEFKNKNGEDIHSADRTKHDNDWTKHE